MNINNILIHHPTGVTSTNHTVGLFIQLLIASPFILAAVLYLLAADSSNQRLKRWPTYRTVCWLLGCLFAGFSLIGSLAQLAHNDFTVHMLAHLLLGMLAPLLMALAAPMTLILRTVNVPLARKLSKLLACWPSKLLTHPIVAASLNIGGLWLLYTTNLYMLMHEHTVLHAFVHFHMIVAGYLFTVSIISIDPMPHKTSFVYRTIVLILALTGHGMLSKLIYAYPPQGVPADQAEIGGILMYYGGDLIDIVLIFIFCWQWYRAARPRLRLAAKG